MRATTSATSSQPSTRSALLGHLPALDGVRGLAVALVVLYHFSSPSSFLPSGGLGLDIFFALSGFLITALLLDEFRVHGRVRLSHFWARRALRLLPALALMLGLWTLLLLAFHDTSWFASTPSTLPPGAPVDVGAALEQVGITLLYGANWIYALGSGAAPLNHLWSLAVEEQFYLLWPLVLLLLFKLRASSQLAALLVLVALSASLPLLLWDGGVGANRIYFGTDTRAVGMLLGALGALIWHTSRARALELSHAPGSPFGASGHSRASSLLAPAAHLALVALLAAALLWENSASKSLLSPTLAAAAATLLITWLASRPQAALARALASPALVWLGRRSYAIYLWHYLFATWLNHLPVALGLTLGVMASLTLAELSWRGIEAPLRHRASRFKLPPAPPPTPTPGPASELDGTPAARPRPVRV